MYINATPTNLYNNIIYIEFAVLIDLTEFRVEGSSGTPRIVFVWKSDPVFYSLSQSKVFPVSYRLSV